ncbi:hypothetical protein GMRT_11113 [Giardia muris]|uniref:Uncharacterized protein n=1 Tax=Giardia muris TaxID=5742 RepID=A0A4Z1SSU5_GIAMU|nr:hypothetical protein GMRT_11113 [Giardia muris]|eukprot:TNJ28944.1 hypothetical protein GMRT_11113 [Giardia muris]
MNPKNDETVEDLTNRVDMDAEELVAREYKRFENSGSIGGTCYSYGTLLEMIKQFSRVSSIKKYWEELWEHRAGRDYPKHSINVLDFELYSFEPFQLSEVGIIKQVGLLPVYGLQSILKPRRMQITKGTWYVRRITGIEHAPGKNQKLFARLEHLDYGKPEVKKVIRDFLHSSVGDLDSWEGAYTDDPYLSDLVTEVIGFPCQCRRTVLPSGLKLYSFKYDRLPIRSYPPLRIPDSGMTKVLVLAKGIGAEVQAMECLGITDCKVHEAQQFYAPFMAADAAQFVARRPLASQRFYCLAHRAIVELSQVKPKDHFHCALEDCIQVSLALWNGLWNSAIGLK